jgi:histidyl-tRNA synthetase
LYSKEKLSGVGSSIGLDRLIAALEQLGSLESGTYAQAAIACIREEDGGLYQALGTRLREKGIFCEVFLEAKKLTQQYILAEKKGIPWMIIPGASPDAPLTLRNLASRENREELSAEQVLEILRLGITTDDTD